MTVNRDANRIFVSPADVLVVGASGRMVAQMLTRLGFRCAVADQFADRDTTEICHGRVIRLRSLDDILAHERLLEATNAVVFAGGLEGHRRLAASIARRTKPLYTDCRSLRLLGNPDVFNKALNEAGIQQGFLRRSAATSSAGQVLKNPQRSGSCRMYFEGNTRRFRDSASHVFQDFIEGQSESMLFVSNDSNTAFLGGSLQLIDSFQWVGSISGSQFEAGELETMCAFAAAIVRQTGLNGVFGIDIIRGESGIVPVDINPRIPASAEVFGNYVVAEHLKAFGVFDRCEVANARNAGQIGKKVVFNSTERPIELLPELLDQYPVDFAKLRTDSRVSIADVPHANERIVPGRPLLTVIAEGQTVDSVRLKLESAEQEILRDFTRP